MKYLDGYPELDLLSRALSFTTPSVRVSTRIEAYSCKAINREKRLFKTLEQDMKSDLELSTSISPPEHHTAIVQSAFGPLNQSGSRKTLWLLIATLNLAFPDHDFSRVNAEEFIKEDSARSVLNSLSSALSNVRATSAGATGPANYRNIGTAVYSSYPPSYTTLPGFNPLQPAGNRKKRAMSKGTAASDSNTGKKKKDGKTVGSKALAASPTDSSGAGSAAFVEHMQNDADSATEIPAQPFLRQVLEQVIELADCEVYSYTPELDSDPHAYQSDDEEEGYTSNDEDAEADMLAAMQVEADELGWDMDGISSSSAPAYSIPPTPTGSSSTKRHRRRRSSMSFRQLSRGTSFGSMSMMDDDGFPKDQDEGDETGGLLWSSNYFLYNRKMRRILFISCWGRKVAGSPAATAMPLPPVQQKIPFTKPVLQNKPLNAIFASGPTTSKDSSFAGLSSSAPSAFPSPPATRVGSSIFASYGRDSELPPMVREVGASSPRHNNVSNASPSPVKSGTALNSNDHDSSTREVAPDTKRGGGGGGDGKRGHKRRASSGAGSVGRSGRRRKSARRGGA